MRSCTFWLLVARRWDRALDRKSTTKRPPSGGAVGVSAAFHAFGGPTSDRIDLDSKDVEWRHLRAIGRFDANHRPNGSFNQIATKTPLIEHLHSYLMMSSYKTFR